MRAALVFYQQRHRSTCDEVRKVLEASGVRPRTMVNVETPSQAFEGSVKDAECIVVWRDGMDSDEAKVLAERSRDRLGSERVFVLSGRNARTTGDWARLGVFVRTPEIRVMTTKTNGIDPKSPAHGLVEMARSFTETEKLANMYAEEAKGLRGRVDHLEAELANAKKQVSSDGRVAREKLTEDLQRANAERTKAQREVAELTERLAASEARCRQAAEVKTTAAPDARIKALLQAWKVGALDAEDVLKRIEKMIGGE